MSRSAEPSRPAGPVELLEVTDHVLDRLLAVALNDADADDVTPPLGGAGWNPERITWFFEYHRAAAAGLDGPARQKSWAISCGGQVAGSIRLRRTGRESVETGLWLGRSFRQGNRPAGTAAGDGRGRGRRSRRPGSTDHNWEHSGPGAAALHGGRAGARSPDRRRPCHSGGADQAPLTEPFGRHRATCRRQRCCLAVHRR